MKKILFNFSNITEFNEQFKLVELLRNRHNTYKVSFIINEYKGAFNVQDLVGKINTLGCECYFEKDIIGNKKNNLISLLYKLPVRLRNFIYKNLSYDVFYFLTTYHKSLLQLKQYSNFLKILTPGLLIVSEDGIGGNIHLIKAAKNLGLKAMILPYEYSSIKQLIIGAKKSHCFLINNTGLSKALFEKHFFLIDKKYFGFYDREQVKAYVKTGVMPINIKTTHGGYADRIAAESPAMYRHYIKEGLNEDKVVLTGSINDDILFAKLHNKENKKKDLYKEFNFINDLPLIVFSFIPEYEGNVMFDTYINYVKQISEGLSKLNNYNILYQFHPAVTQKQRLYAYELNLAISDLPTIELISVADLYITSYSSTIRWAIAASVPVIHLDLYNFDYDDYKGCKGIKFLASKDDFMQTIEKLQTNDEFFNELKLRQIEESVNWGILDGKSGNRILNLIEELCQ